MLSAVEREKIENTKESYLKRISSIKSGLEGMWDHEVVRWKKQIKVYENEIEKLDSQLKGDE